MVKGDQKIFNQFSGDQPNRRGQYRMLHTAGDSRSSASLDLNFDILHTPEIVL
jgi:hypothetical protein